MTWHTFFTTTPAGAPPGCPAAASQSRNWPKTVSWTDPYFDMQSLKSEALALQMSWKVIGSQPPPCAAAAVTKLSISDSCMLADPSGAIVRIAYGSLGGIVSTYGAVGVVLELEMPPPTRALLKPHCWTTPSTVELYAPKG